MMVNFHNHCKVLWRIQISLTTGDMELNTVHDNIIRKEIRNKYNNDNRNKWIKFLIVSGNIFTLIIAAATTVP